MFIFRGELLNLGVVINLFPKNASWAPSQNNTNAVDALRRTVAKLAATYSNGQSWRWVGDPRNLEAKFH